MTKKNKILIGHPYFGRGGAEIATMWLIEALKKNYSIHIITRGGWNLDELNHCSGTNVINSDINLVKLPANFLLKQTFAGYIWHGLFLRYCRRISSCFDLCISAARPIDWGVKAVHILADVSWNIELQKKYSPQEQLKLKGIRLVLYKIGKLISGKSKRGIKDDYYIANSNWTAEVSRPYCSVKPTVIYPPVTGKFFNKNWDNKKDDFVYLGRIAKEKRLELAIDILNEVRNNGLAISFHICGKFENDEYSNFITNLCNKYKDWIILHGAVYNEQKYRLLSENKYGINARKEEPFGISTAEMVKSGMLPFICNAGGQIEIVPNEDLQFSNKEVAIERICQLVSNRGKQMKLSKEIEASAKMFNTEIFCNHILSFFLNLDV